MANTRIKGQQVQDGGIQTADIADGNVTTAKLAANAATAPKILLASNPALEDDGSGALRVKEDAAGGIVRTASGLQHKAFRTEATDPVSPADGEVWYNSAVKRAKMRSAGTNGRLQQTLTTNITNSSAIANTTAKTAYGHSVTIPADWWYAGKAIRIVGQAIYSTTGTPTLALDAELGGQSLFSRAIVLLAAAVGFRWYFDITIICYATGASGQFMRGGALYYERSTSADNNHLVPVGGGAVRTMDMTVDQTINVYATWSAADASNTTEMFLFTAELLN